jgi:hypothetical protein
MKRRADVDHWAHCEAPDAARTLLLDFLRGLHSSD